MNHETGKIRDRKTNRTRKTTSLDETRVRFNWGYHDAKHDHTSKRTRPDGLGKYTILENHFDPAYAEGWLRGWQDCENGAHSNSSESAWESAKHKATLLPKHAPYRRIT